MSDVRFFRDYVGGRQGEILDAALAVFADRGYDGGTMRQIASRVGVSEPAIYRHFASKEALFERFVEMAGARLLARTDAILADIDPAALPDSIGSHFERHRREIVSAVPVLRVLAAEALRRPAVLDLWRRHFVGPLRERVAATIRRLDDFHGLHTTDQELAGRVRFAMAVGQGYLLTGLLFGDVGTETFLEMCIRAAGWDE